MHFLGPLRGLLPLGPNGVPVPNALPYPSFLNNTDPKAEQISYNYTLDLQGLSSSISCSYANSTPIIFSSVANGGPWVFNYTSTCLPPNQDILLNVNWTTLDPGGHLGFWACKMPSLGGVDQYVLYLSGRGYYATAIGNITCILSPVQPAIFPVTYRSQSGFFSAQNHTTISTNTSSTNASSHLIERAIRGLGSVMLESQNTDSNVVAESIIATGVKSFGLQPYVQDPKYLQLYEAMFQGIIEYEVCSNAPLCIVISQYPAVGHIHPLDICAIHPTAQLLQPHRDWTFELYGNWVVRES